MNEKELRKKIVDQMVSWYGMDRANGTHKPILDIYNSQKPLPRSYKVQLEDNYCATGVSAAAIACGLQDIFPMECSCGFQIELWEKMGRWQEKDSYVPEPGDVIYFDWDDTGKPKDNQGWPEHVGIVKEVVDSVIKTIECNKSGKVAYRFIKVDGQYIRGYGLPDYASKATAAAPSSSTAAPTCPSNPQTGLNRVPTCKGVVTASSLRVRKWAGTNYDTCTFSPLKKDTVVEICDTIHADDGNPWFYIKYNGKYGFVSATYVNVL